MGGPDAYGIEFLVQSGNQKLTGEVELPVRVGRARQNFIQFTHSVTLDA